MKSAAKDFRPSATDWEERECCASSSSSKPATATTPASGTNGWTEPRSTTSAQPPASAPSLQNYLAPRNAILGEINREAVIALAIPTYGTNDWEDVS